MSRASPKRAIQALLPVVAAAVLWGSCTEQLKLGTLGGPGSDAGDGEDAAGPGVGQSGDHLDGGDGRGGNAFAGVGVGGRGCENAVMREAFVEPGRPLAFVALQNSASMFDKLGERSKIEQAAFALERAIAGRRLPVGFVQFPGTLLACNSDQACCSTGVVVTPKVDAGKAIRRSATCDGQTLLCSATNNSVPTKAALQQIRGFIRAFNVPGRRAVLLLTDSDPTCDGANPCDAAVAETAGLAQEDTETYVFALGSGSASQSCLSRIARAGDTLAADIKLPAVTTDAELDAALQSALNEIESGFCQARLRFAPKRPEELRLFVDGVQVSSFAMAKGSTTRLEIFGPPCEKLKRQSADVRAYEVCCGGDRDCHL